MSTSASFQMRSDEYVAQLAVALANNQHVKELNLTNCNIGDKGGERLGELLAANRVITTLLLERNRLGQIGGAALAR